MLILTLALIGGKLDDPAPAIPIGPITASHKLDDPAGWPPRVLPVAFRDDEPPLAKAQTPKPSEPTPKVPSSTAAAAPPKIWQLVDRSGQRWTHTNPQWLQIHVGRVNAALAPRYYAPVLQYGSPCANGACPR